MPSVALLFSEEVEALKAADVARRLEAAQRLGSVGSAAALPLLRAAVGDASPDVREAAAWSLLDVADGLEGENHREAREISKLIEAGESHSDAMVQAAITAARLKRDGRDPALAVSDQLGSFSARHHPAGMRLLERLLEGDHSSEKALRKALKSASRHWSPFVRLEARRLAEQWSLRAQPPGPRESAVVFDPERLFDANRSIRRRHIALAADAGLEAAPFLFEAIKDDPDCEVRLLAGVGLYRLAGEGLPKSDLQDHEARDPEVADLLDAAYLRASNGGEPIQRLESLLNQTQAIIRVRAVRLAARLRPHLSPLAASTMDELIAKGLSDDGALVRRAALSAVRQRTSERTSVALINRLNKQKLRRASLPTALIFTLSQMGGIVNLVTKGTSPVASVAAIVGLVAASIWICSAFVDTQDSETLETLEALAQMADAEPERLEEVRPKLKRLASRFGSDDREVRALARELLQRLDGGPNSTAALPIAALAPEPSAQSLPRPAGES